MGAIGTVTVIGTAKRRGTGIGTVSLVFLYVVGGRAETETMLILGRHGRRSDHWEPEDRRNGGDVSSFVVVAPSFREYTDLFCSAGDVRGVALALGGGRPPHVAGRTGRALAAARLVLVLGRAAATAKATLSLAPSAAP